MNIVKMNDTTLIHGDAFKEIKDIETESIGLSIFSPAFPELYCYSDDVRDLGNCKDYDEFKEHFKFLPPELFRVMQQGRNVCIHCMDVPIQKGKHGFIGLRDFSGLILKEMTGLDTDEVIIYRWLKNKIEIFYKIHCDRPDAGITDSFVFRNLKEHERILEEKISRKAGFIYHSRITIWKNPVTEMQRTKALGLLHKQIKKDSTMSRVGIPDYVLVFRKDGERLNPVKCGITVDTWQEFASPVWKFDSVDKDIEMILPLLDEDTFKKLPSSIRNKYNAPVWMDIDYGNTLNGKIAREERDEKHICPLQLDTIERLTMLYSNEGDTCFTPFAGIGSEPYQWLSMNRKTIAIELKQSYFDLMVKNCQSMLKSKKQLAIL